MQAAAGVLTLGDDGEEGHVRFALNECMVAAAYAWAAGAPFAALHEHTTLQEGDIIRVLSRVEELAKEVRTAGMLLGDALLVKTVDELRTAIKRDVVAAPSLYVDELVG